MPITNLVFAADRKVVINVSALAPTPGYRLEIRQSPDRILPPEYDLIAIPPAVTIPQVESPAFGRAEFDIPAGQTTLTIRHNGSKHVVEITQ